MFIKSKRLGVVRIPKTGSTSLEALITNTYPKHDLTAAGHIPMTQMMEKAYPKALAKDYRLTRFVTVIRHPFARFVSAVNHKAGSHGGEHAPTLDHIMDLARGPFSWTAPIVFIPQYRFLDLVGVRCRMFKLENIQGAAEAIGCGAVVPHKNVGTGRFSPREIKDHKWFIEAFWGKYMMDYELYRRAK